MSLDVRFGDLLMPARVSDCEKRFAPATLLTLGHQTARILELIAATDPESWRLSELIFHELPILWIVDRDGDVRFALEEVVDLIKGTVQYPKPRKVQIQPKTGKLGHPSLVDGDSARIGGEFYFDPGDNFRGWVLTNQSGRYGLNCGRTSRQLENVADIFRGYGVKVTSYFVGI